MIDLRSDTVTKPSAEMLAAMQSAAVGDDVYSEDPTVNALEERVASLLGLESALFVPSGTMSNQIAVRLHCRPGDELLCEATSHVVLWEASAAAALSGVSCHTLHGKNGHLTLEQYARACRPDDIHSPRTRLVWLENTHNRGGGTIQPLAEIEKITAWAKSNQLGTHLDGARLWNAAIATHTKPEMWGRNLDTVSVCFSKGLGAPVGSALVGSKDHIRDARRYRKMFGGGMRQAGYLAAACLYALENNVDRLADDHINAQLLADAVKAVEGFELTPSVVDTNLVWFTVDRKIGTPQEVAIKLREHGIRVSALGEATIRMCTHLDVTDTQCKQTAETILKLFG